MLAIASLCSGVESGNAVGAGAAVGIGAIFRAVSRDILRTPIGSASRASAQAVARGWVHGSIRHVWQMRPAGFSLAVAFISLAISYGAVVAFARPELAGDRPFWAIGVLGAIPILVYRGLTWCFGRLWSVEITPRIHADGLLMQAYFTAALSFLPLAFDAEYRGRREHRSLAALS